MVLVDSNFSWKHKNWLLGICLAYTQRKVKHFAAAGPKVTQLEAFALEQHVFDLYVVVEHRRTQFLQELNSTKISRTGQCHGVCKESKLPTIWLSCIAPWCQKLTLPCRIRREKSRLFSFESTQTPLQKTGQCFYARAWLSLNNSNQDLQLFLRHLQNVRLLLLANTSQIIFLTAKACFVLTSWLFQT